MDHPTHHVPEELLLAYGAGTGDEPLSLVVGTHVALCPACQSVVGEIERLGGVLLEDLPAEPVRAGALEALLLRLDEPVPAAAPAGPAIELPSYIPEPLRPYLVEAGGLRWRWALPGVRQMLLPLEIEGRKLRLLHFKPGTRLAHHGHKGQELSVVLTGGFTADQEHFLRGDVALADEGMHHEPVVDEGEECVLLVAGVHASVAQTGLGRALTRLLGL